MQQIGFLPQFLLGIIFFQVASNSDFYLYNADTASGFHSLKDLYCDTRSLFHMLNKVIKWEMISFSTWLDISWYHTELPQSVCGCVIFHLVF